MLNLVLVSIFFFFYLKNHVLKLEFLKKQHAGLLFAKEEQKKADM